MDKKFSIGQRVKTPSGEGTIIDFKVMPYDGDCYLIEFGSKTSIIDIAWRTAKVLEPIGLSSEMEDKIATAIATNFNLDLNEVKNIINGINNIGG